MKESEVKTLPRSFKVLYLQVFITGDPAEIPLCPGGALKSILSRVAKPLPLPHTLVSPRILPVHRQRM